MIKPLSHAIVALSIAMSIGSSGASLSAREPLAGAWRLVWLEEAGADGNVHKADCTGLFVFTRDGHASVQVMYRHAQTAANATSAPSTTGSEPVQYAQGGYEASFGRYDVDERARTFTFHVEGALVRSLIGKDLVRVYELSGNQLIVKSANPSERWRVAWERVESAE